MKNLQKWLLRALMVALLCGLIGGAYAKYVKQDTLEGTVTIKANLGTIELLEHKANRKATGDYELTDTLLPIQDNPDTDIDETDLGNAYILLPGLDIPKDPFVRITNKTPIEVYVFVEVVTNIVTDNKDATDDTDFTDDHNISYSLTSDWLKISENTADGVTTAVYVYKDVIDENFGTSGTGTIQILENNTIYVSQKLNVPTDGVYLNFSASMYEVASGDSALTVYQNNTQNNSEEG